MKFLDYWLLNHHSDVGRATQPIFRVHLSINVQLSMLSSSTPIYHLIWQMLSPCSHDCGNPSFWKSGGIVAESISHLLTSPWFNDELLFQEPAPIVHFPRILQCHFNDLCCAFSSQTSWVWGIMTPIGSESRSDMMVGTTFQELWCWSLDDPVIWCHA